ncbi:uncharacterized protein LOC113277148 [Papaver somniferum]|uniref:uncharacterized protein LOC113277148 n=1 Tax=Papaver somniferum TaxID=3469 RepID=UPI000E6FC8CD|nr:uncharacterized protein LOC113277148 [Papaver somniferum]
MSPDKNSTSRAKEFSSPPIQVPILNATNYTVWDTIEPGTDDADKNNIAIRLLFQAIPEYLVLQVGEQQTSRNIWYAIKARNLGVDRFKEARLQTLMSEFERIKMKETDAIDNFARKLSEIASKAASLGQPIEENKLVKKFLNSLPRSKYIHIIASLEKVLYLKTTSYEDIIGRLKVYEERILDEDNNSETQGKLLYSNSSQTNASTTRGRGRGRGGRGNRRGRGGRIQKIEEANKNETSEAETALFMHEVIFLNKEKLIPKNYDSKDGEGGIWYLDNGASNHMTGKRHYFSELNKKIKGKVKFGDGSSVETEGKGSILFQSKTGEQKLVTNIYFIPNL